MFRRSPRAALIALLAIAVLGATGLVASDDSSQEATTAKLVAQMVERFHISGQPLNDEISKKTFKRYLSELDPMKLYFLQSDIDQLSQYRTKLDEMTLAGDTSFAHKAYALYLKRLEERIQYAQKLIDSQFDFTMKESIMTDSDKRDWADSLKEIQDRWRKRIKYDILSLKLDDVGESAEKKEDAQQDKTSGDSKGDSAKKDDSANSKKKTRERLHERYHNILVMTRQTGRLKRLEIFLSALTHSYDPHSSYMSPMTLENFRISMELQLEGIGAELRSEDGYVVVNRIVEGGAAADDGRLEAEDKIIGVRQGDEEKYTDVVEMRLTQVVQLIRGDAGSVVWLQVKKPSGEVKEYKLVRQHIELKEQAVRGEIIDTSKRIGGPGYRVGVINIPSFYRDFQGAHAGEKDFASTSRDVLKVLQSFEQKGGVDAIVIDLRFNGGGALTEAIEVSGLFIEQGPVVQVKTPDGEVDVYADDDGQIAYSGPLVVLTNRLSASASEIFTGAMKDYRRAIVIGDSTTHGKGTVQDVLSVPPQFLSFLSSDEKRGALKLTISQFYRVNGDSTQIVGVPSDIILPSMTDHLEIGEQFLDNALPFDHINPAKYAPLAGYRGKKVISTLQQASAARIAESKKFQQLKEDIAEVVKDIKDAKVSLNMAVRTKEILEAKQKSDVTKEIAEEARSSRDDDTVLPENYHNKEILRITADYLEQLRGARTAGTQPRAPATSSP